MVCLSCSSPLFLYSEECLEECPVTHSLVGNDSECISCQTVVIGCSNCSENGECYECYSPRIYFDGECPSKCPTGYVLIDFGCEVSNATEQTLDTTLTDGGVALPLPFTILAGIFFIACCMSKLQNYNTYLVGALYSLLGLVETTAIAYLSYRYYSIGHGNYDLTFLLLLLSALGVIYLLNLLGLLVQTMLLLYDRRFQHWLHTPSNKCFYSFVVVFSAALNYKLKMIVFTRLFKFDSMSARLEDVSKFRMFNVYSFFGLVGEAAALFVCFNIIGEYRSFLPLFYPILDVIVVCIVNVLLAVLIAWKSQDFFHEQDGDYTLHKKIIIDGDDYSKEAIQVGGDDIDHGGDSYTAMKGAVIH